MLVSGFTQLRRILYRLVLSSCVHLCYLVYRKVKETLENPKQALPKYKTPAAALAQTSMPPPQPLNFSRNPRPPMTSGAARRYAQYHDATTSIRSPSPSSRAPGASQQQQPAAVQHDQRPQPTPPPPPYPARAIVRTPTVSNASSFCRRLCNESAIHFSPVDLDLALVELDGNGDELSLIESYEHEMTIRSSRRNSLDIAASAAPLSHLLYRSSATQTEMGKRAARRLRSSPMSPYPATATATGSCFTPLPVRMNLYPHSEGVGGERSPRSPRRPCPLSIVDNAAGRMPSPQTQADIIRSYHQLMATGYFHNGSIHQSACPVPSRATRPLPLELDSPTLPLIATQIKEKTPADDRIGSPPSSPPEKMKTGGGDAMSVNPDDEMSELPTGIRFYMILVSLLLCVYLMALDLVSHIVPK